ncbi:methylenetetrahydrofolate reductase, partial [uncultured Muribaculum sp.]
MKVTELIASHGKTGFSFEVLPPLKGKGIAQLFRNIDILKEFNPLFINITTHRSEMVYKNTPDGLYQKVSERSRPGTVAVAAAIQQKYNIPAVPHIICSGFSKIETEYALIDLNFLGITNILILRGDKAKHESRFIPNENGYSHASELQLQINEFNRGYFI